MMERVDSDDARVNDDWWKVGGEDGVSAIVHTNGSVSGRKVGLRNDRDIDRDVIDKESHERYSLKDCSWCVETI